MLSSIFNLCGDDVIAPALFHKDAIISKLWNGYLKRRFTIESLFPRIQYTFLKRTRIKSYKAITFLVSVRRLLKSRTLPTGDNAVALPYPTKSQVGLCCHSEKSAPSWKIEMWKKSEYQNVKGRKALSTGKTTIYFCKFGSFKNRIYHYHVVTLPRILTLQFFETNMTRLLLYFNVNRENFTPSLPISWVLWVSLNQRTAQVGDIMTIWSVVVSGCLWQLCLAGLYVNTTEITWIKVMYHQ